MGILGPFLKRRGRDRMIAARARGNRAEHLVVAALRRASRPGWLISVRRASKKDDHRGIDVVVETSDCGRLFLQVKSSRTGAEHWQEIHGKNGLPIGLVIVEPERAEKADLNWIYGLALGQLILLRERSSLPRTRT